MPLPIPKSQTTDCPSGCRAKIVRRGHFVRARDRKSLQRFNCHGCGRSFSEATRDPCVNQKKRDVNPLLFRLLTGGYSQRRAALDLGVSRTTVARKFIFLGRAAMLALREFNLQKAKATCWEFDDLETLEHSKYKPLSAIAAVEYKSRRILGFRVASMPPKGRTAKAAFKKYGPRKEERSKARSELFEELKGLVEPDALIRSDENPYYVSDVRRHFPGAIHERVRSRRACVTGQGELKVGAFDPIFSLNHTFAMMRANISRLIRRTWCTTKLKERLTLHLALYAIRHNQDLI